jgi:biotin operon repressor
MKKDAMSFDEAAGKLLQVLAMHVGREHAIDMGELYTRVFGKLVNHKINESREVRKLITALRRKGIPIGSTSRTNGGGYYLVRASSELDEYCSSLRQRALRALVMEARLRKIGMPELLGQMQMNLSAGERGGV